MEPAIYTSPLGSPPAVPVTGSLTLTSPLGSPPAVPVTGSLTLTLLLGAAAGAWSPR